MTKALIGIIEDNGSITSIRCRLDGGIERTGILLFTAYSELEKIRLLINNGDIEKLGVFVENNTSWKEKHSTVFYRRDYQEEEKFNKENEYSSINILIKNNESVDFYYLFNNHKWSFMVKSKLQAKVYSLENTITKFYEDSQEEIKIVLEKGETENED